jgi:hypothetical protein
MEATVNILCYAWRNVSTLSTCYDTFFSTIHHESQFTPEFLLGHTGADSDRWQQSNGCQQRG